MPDPELTAVQRLLGMNPPTPQQRQETGLQILTATDSLFGVIVGLKMHGKATCEILTTNTNYYCENVPRYIR